MSSDSGLVGSTIIMREFECDITYIIYVTLIGITYFVVPPILGKAPLSFFLLDFSAFPTLCTAAGLYFVTHHLLTAIPKQRESFFYPQQHVLHFANRFDVIYYHPTTCIQSDHSQWPGSYLRKNDDAAAYHVHRL